MWAAFWAMAAFFMIPVTAVQGLLTMNSFLRCVGRGMGSCASFKAARGGLCCAA